MVTASEAEHAAKLCQRTIENRLGAERGGIASINSILAVAIPESLRALPKLARLETLATMLVFEAALFEAQANGRKLSVPEKRQRLMQMAELLRDAADLFDAQCATDKVKETKNG